MELFDYIEVFYNQRGRHSILGNRKERSMTKLACVARWGLALVAGVVILQPAAALAQASITGVVKDSSGAVLPGVTVEASSPELIEKVRTVVSDSGGQYQIVSLRPGTFAVTFALAGFNTLKRDGIELTGNFTATVNAELRVGSLEETLTVTGEAPIVDVSNANRQRVLRQDIIDALPNNRVPAFMASLVPGINMNSQDVGGSQGNTDGGRITTHGSRITDLRTMASGVSIQSMESGAGAQGVPNMMMYQEVTVDTSGTSAEQDLAGVTINMIPREGGNTYQGSFLTSFANNGMQGNNFTQDLKDRGLRTADAIKQIWDINPGYGGPIKKDRLWFFATYRYTGATNYVGGMFFNANVGNPNAYTYVADTAQQAYTENIWQTFDTRVTWQATPKHKIAVGFDQAVAQRPAGITATVTPEAATYQNFHPDRSFRGEWTAPLTSRLLAEAVLYERSLPSFTAHGPGVPSLGLSSITEQATGVRFRAIQGTVSQKVGTNVAYRASVSYVTGSHAFKFGFNDGQALRKETVQTLDSPVAFRVNNGVPNQLTEFYSPAIACDNVNGCDRYQNQSHLDHDMGVFAADKWALQRLTLSYGLRYSWYKTTFPATHVQPGSLAPNLNLDIPETSGVNWKDVVPRLAAVYNVFGTGKTAVKVSVNKYVAGQALLGTGPTLLFGGGLNPFNRLVLSTTRNWTDSNRNFVPDCDLTNSAAQNLTASGGDVCAAMANQNFGKTVPGTNYDPATLSGFGARGSNWEYTAGIQQQILPQTSVEFGFFRRTYANFVVTDNRSVAASDYTQYQITAPADQRLPNGGNYPVTGLYDLNENKVGQVDNYITFAEDGAQSEKWNGVDITANSRFKGIQIQGGLSTGRSTTDNCGVVAKLPEILGAGVPLAYCHFQEPFRTQVKFIGTYAIPKIDVRFSGSFQSVPGPLIAANQVLTSAQVAPSLGRPLSGGAANVTVNILEPGAMYGERVNQLDLRFSKILRAGKTRATLNFDVPNVFNANPVLTESPVYTTWRRPESILTARFVKVGLQLNF
ncbi:MAG: TonB-dependent receptor [Acidobacteria bacterium]|nr:TonB-dependent receptor [Acidobacteriota bacterium]